MIDRIALRIVLTMLAGLLALGVANRAKAERIDGLVPGDYCDSSDGARSWTTEQKRRTRARVWAACKSIGAADHYCAIWDVAVVRESWGGVASAVHTLGTDADGDPEFGLGPMGLSVKWHRDKWPGDDELPAFCTPEASFLVAHAIAMRAVHSYGADTAVEIQAIYGGGRGAVGCIDDGFPDWWRHIPVMRWFWERGRGRRRCFAVPSARHYAAVCSRMPAGMCTKLIRPSDLGDATGLVEWSGWRYVVTARGRRWALAARE